jgi:hypothetical protein
LSPVHVDHHDLLTSWRMRGLVVVGAGSGMDGA